MWCQRLDSICGTPVTRYSHAKERELFPSYSSIPCAFLRIWSDIRGQFPGTSLVQDGHCKVKKGHQKFPRNRLQHNLNEAIRKACGLQEGGGPFGANRWDEAAFTNSADRQKFNKLMGMKAAGDQPSEHSRQAEDERGVLSADQQALVLTEVETHFMQGLRRADGRKVGLGL